MVQRILWRIEHVGMILQLASLAVALFSGAVLGLFYYPSNEPISGQLYYAESVIIDRAGDTVLQKGDLALLDTVPPHRGVLTVVGDSMLQWNTALASHAAIAATTPGGILISIHQTASTVLVGSLALSVATLVLSGYQNQCRKLWIVGLLLCTMTASWLGTVLPADRRAFDAYMIGRAFLTENLPIVGDLIAAVFPQSVSIPRVFVLHGIWFPALMIALMLIRRIRVQQWARETVGISALVVMLIGIARALVIPPGIVAVKDVPLWHLGVPYVLLHLFPMDATMLFVLGWWSGAVVCGSSSRLWVRAIGASLITTWFLAGLIITWFSA